jgi:hypothetical protein
LSPYDVLKQLTALIELEVCGMRWNSIIELLGDMQQLKCLAFVSAVDSGIAAESRLSWHQWQC